MAKPKFRDIKIQRNGKFNTNGTVHETIEEAFAYWNKKLPNNSTTYLIYPSNESFDFTITCFSLGYAKQCLGV
ncbi:MAG: hypothetical protein HXK95_03600 [Candidatus Nanogingivalaceae bacterium]|nr:MAG: hypothetical protein HXK95_03600 [Candidatus Nanogingivalaceae bacterium]